MLTSALLLAEFVCVLPFALAPHSSKWVMGSISHAAGMPLIDGGDGLFVALFVFDSGIS
jgi:hypothetical protein